MSVNPHHSTKSPPSLGVYDVWAERMVLKRISCWDLVWAGRKIPILVLNPEMNFDFEFWSGLCKITKYFFQCLQLFSSSFLLLRKLDLGGLLSCISRRGKRCTGISSRLSFDQELGVIVFSDSDLGTQLLLKSNFRSMDSCPSRGSCILHFGFFDQCQWLPWRCSVGCSKWHFFLYFFSV